ncbi:PAS domain S-box protein [Halorussus ruber]|uniref:PAS domain S-box protein n=1 Tax=Halorussus ruber TaxID=1126238 RepID=UPI0010928641|nr:PAS domain S-box protein [Halorussus ruber]
MSPDPTRARVLAALDALGGECEPVTANEIAAELDCSREVATEGLAELAEQGDVATKTVGGDRRVWWRPPDAGRLDRARFRSLVEAVDEYAIFMLDPEGHVVTWNEGARRIKGYDPEDIVGEHFSTFYTDEDREAGVPEENLEAARTEGHVEDEGWRVRKDGTRFWANVVITAIRDDEGELQGFAKVTRDMTERREREEQLRRERDQTERLLETSPVPISVRDDDGNIVIANERTEKLLEQSEAELHGVSSVTSEVAFYTADGEPMTADDLPAATVLETGDPVTDRELVVEKSDGERRWFSLNAAPVPGPDGDVERVITVGEDVTALKEREQELETELSEILGRVSDAFYALDEEYRFTHVNERAEELLQHSEEKLLGRSLWDVFPEAAEEDDVWDSFQTAIDTQEPTSFELFFPPLDFWVEANVYPSETGVSVYFRDVTERVEREQALAESERRYRTLAEEFPNGVVTLYDDDLRYKIAAGQAFEKLPVSGDELEGRCPREVFGDEVGGALEDAFRSALDGEPTSVEIRYAGRDWMVRAVPVSDDGSEAVTGLAMAQDITDRKERERRLERFASVVSHGLRNPLTIAEIYLDQARDGDPAAFDQVGQALERMERIIQNLLTTALEGETTSEPEPVELAAVSEAGWRNVETSDATLTVEDDGEVVADEDQLQMALENLFCNAVEYGGDNVSVRVGPIAGEGEPGFYVEDDGPGIPPADREEVFEYGYTSESGTGIGLAVVRDIVEAHGWDVSVTDGTDGGARFEIRGVENETSDEE